MDLLDENVAWSTRCRQLRARSDNDFREAGEKANELHATGDLFAKRIEPEPAPADPVEWPMTEASEDADDAPVPDAPASPELELIDMPPVPASAPPMSNLERCIAVLPGSVRRKASFFLILPLLLMRNTAQGVGTSVRFSGV